ncbi:hypothetical protein VPHK406_0117 [Vibrio phage K406]
MTIKIIEETIKAYSEVINSDCSKERERFFRIALENVEREARHAATKEVFQLANDLHNKKHY